jgi:outer membrane immunogenic protein
MKKFLAAGLGMLAVAAMQPANAADMPVKAVYKAPPVAVWAWDYFYLGLNGGYSWGRSRTDGAFYNDNTGVLLASASNTVNLNGGIFGGQIGKNWQSGNTVFGIEADIQWSGEKGGTSFTCPTPAFGGPCNLITGGPGAGVAPTAAINQKIAWFGTLRGRLGATVTPSTLLYVTGGLAYGGIKTDGVISGFNVIQVPTTLAFSHSSTRAGWVIGAGLEGHLGGNWTGKIEGLYMDLGSVSGSGVLPSNPPLRATYNSRITDAVVRVGVNYHLGGAVVAKY